MFCYGFARDGRNKEIKCDPPEGDLDLSNPAQYE